VWWAGPEPWDVYLGTRAVLMARGDECVSRQHVNDAEAAWSVFSEALNVLPSKARLRIWLSGGHCRPFLLPPLPGVKRGDEWRRAAEALVEQHTGLTGPCTLQMQPEQPDGSRLVVAVGSEVVQRVTEGVAQAGRSLRLRSLRPWWAAALHHVLAHRTEFVAVAVQDCDSLTVLSGQGGVFASASTLAPVYDAGVAASALARLSAVNGWATDRTSRVALRMDAAGELQQGWPLGRCAEVVG